MQILEFISDGGLEQPQHINSKLLEKNFEDIPIMVDAYGFYSGFIYGYIAFFKSKTGHWVIKSLKKNKNPDPRNFALWKLGELLSTH
jgi:hypothetical protein